MPGFQLDQTFFGYKPSHRIQFHENLFELIWAGEGRWTFEDIYYMPIPMRKFWINKMNDIYQSKSSNSNNTKNTTPIAKPPIKR